MNDTQTYERTVIYSGTILDSISQWFGIDDWELAYADHSTWGEGLDALTTRTVKQTLELLKEFQDYCGNAKDVFLIPENKFGEYVRDLVEELYDLDSIPDFILDNVNWDGVVSDIKVDYTECEWNGVTYYYR